MTPFQFIVTGLFVAFTIVGIGIFALFGGLGGSGGAGQVAVWGTLPAEQVENMLIELRPTNEAFEGVTYSEKNPATYQGELISAMAAGTGPDLFFLTHEDLGTFGDKVLIIPYGMVSQTSFINSFVDGARLFLGAEGSLALPVLVDPLVMYWNRDLFASAGVAEPPKYWNDFLALAPKLTAHDTVSAVSRSAVALGEWQNIRTAKAILSTLFMQAGDPIVAASESGLYSTLGSLPPGTTEAPAQSALRFYTEFANPTKSIYSWNRSLPEAQTAFAAGDVGVYFGFASEYETLRARNPNLRFGVEVLPQIQGGGTVLAYGKFTGVAVSRSARNPQGAALVAQHLSAAPTVSFLSAAQGLPPVRRDLASDTSASAVSTALAQSALIARGWFDPSPLQTDTVFQGMIESVSTGRSTPEEAIGDAARLLEELLRGGRI